MPREVNRKNRIMFVDPSQNDKYQITINGKDTESTPNLEDMCIWVQLTCFSPYFIENGTGNLAVTWVSSEKSTTVSFMNGTDTKFTRVDGKSSSDGTLLSTEPYDFSTYNSIKDGKFTTQECFGINSIDISYDAMLTPQVTIEFTDIRGISLFASEELRHTIGKEDSYGSFFKCFFTFPYPRFHLQVKGIYGQPANFDLTCYDFQAKFDCKTGNFNATARFLGYTYALLNDVSFSMLVAAPYTPRGRAYWQDQVNRSDNPFRIEGSEMPTLVEMMTEICQVTQAMNIQSNINEAIADDAAKVQSYVNVLTAVNAYLNAIISDLSSISYIKCVTNSENSKICILRYGIHYDKPTMNSASSAYKDLLDACNPLSLTPPTAFEFDTYSGERKTKTSSNLVPSLDGSDVFHKQIKQYIEGQKKNGDAFKDVPETYIWDGSSIVKSATDNIKKSEETQKEKEEEVKSKAQQAVVEHLGFMPSIENITRICVAHLETFLFLISKTEEEVFKMNASNRSAIVDASINYLGDTPFPKLSSSTTESDGSTKQVDVWMGNLTNGDIQPEVNLVNELIEGVKSLAESMKTLEQAKRAAEESVVNVDGSVSYNIIPTTALDLITNQSPLARIDTSSSNVADFIGKLALRCVSLAMLGGEYTSITNYAASMDAKNFVSVADKPSQEFANRIFGENAISDDFIFNLLTKTSGSDVDAEKIDGKLPWSRSNSTEALFKLKDGTKDKVTYPNDEIIPINNFDFKKYVSNLDSHTSSSSNKISLISNDYAAIYDSNPEYFQMAKIIKKYSYEKFFGSYSKIFELTEDEQEKIKNRFKDLNVTKNDYTNKLQDRRHLFRRKISTSEEGVSKWAEYFKGGIFDSGKPKTSMDINKLAENSKLSGYDITEINDIGDLAQFTIPTFGQVYLSDDNTTHKNLNAYLSQKHITSNTKYYLKVDDVSADYTNKSVFLYGTYNGATNNYAKLGVILHSLKDIIGKKDTIFYSFQRDSVYTCYASSLYYIILLYGSMCYFGGYENDGLLKSFAEEFKSFADSSTFKNFINTYEIKGSLRENILNKKWSEVAKDKNFCEGENRPYSKIYDLGEKGIILYNNENNKELNEFCQALLEPCMVIMPICKKVYKTHDVTRSWERLSYVDKSTITKYINNFITELKNNGWQDAVGEVDPTSNTTNAASVTTSSLKNDDVKLAAYSSLKNIYDRWLRFCSKPMDNNINGNIKQRWQEWTLLGGLMENWKFIDAYYNKVGNLIPINYGYAIDLSRRMLENPQSVGLLSFLSEIYKDANCSMHCIQNFLDFSSNVMQQNLSRAFDVIPQREMDTHHYTPSIVVLYSEPSSQLDMGEDYPIQSDSFLLNGDDSQLPLALRDSTLNNGYMLPAFLVSYGKQYQHFFTDLNIETSTPTMTDVSINNLYAIASSALKQNDGTASESENGHKATYVGQDLYTIYSTQSYSCDVTMLGCAWIQPLMYFVLSNVPLFRGSYMIFNVSHSITPGNMVTKFKGQRMSNQQKPFVKNFAYYSNPSSLGGYGASRFDEGTIASLDNDCAYKFFNPISVDGETPITEEVLQMTLGEYENQYGKFMDDTCNESKTSCNYNIFNKGDNDKHIFSRTDNNVMDLLCTILASEAGPANVADDITLKSIASTWFGRSAKGNFVLSSNKVRLQHNQGAMTEQGYKIYKNSPSKYQEIIREVFIKSPISLIGEQTTVYPSTNPKKIANKGKEIGTASSKKITENDVTKNDAYTSVSCFDDDNERKNGHIGYLPGHMWYDRLYYLYWHDYGQKWGNVYCSENNVNLWKVEDFTPKSKVTNDSANDKAWKLTEGVINAMKKTMAFSNAITSKGEITVKKVSSTIANLTCSDQDTLVQAFDILLNTYYDKYIYKLWWITNSNDGLQGKPIKIQIETANVPSYHTCYIATPNSEGKEIASTKINETTALNDKFLLSLKKKFYKDNTFNENDFKKQCYNFTEMVKIDGWQDKVKAMLKGEINPCNRGGFYDDGKTYIGTTDNGEWKCGRCLPKGSCTKNILS